MLRRQRVGAVLAGLALGLVLAPMPLALALLVVGVMRATAGELLALMIVIAAAPIVAWPVTFAVLAIARVDRAAALTWRCCAVAVGTSVASVVVVAGLALIGMALELVLRGSSQAYHWLIPVAAVLAAAATVVVSIRTTTAFARVSAPTAPATPMTPAAPDPRI